MPELPHITANLDFTIPSIFRGTSAEPEAEPEITTETWTEVIIEAVSAVAAEEETESEGAAIAGVASVLIDEPEEEPEEPEIENVCANCDGNEDTCGCSRCETCERFIETDCACIECRHCFTRFSRDAVGSCAACEYCRACIRNGRVDHVQCGNCEQCLPEYSSICHECGAGSCCVVFRCEEEDCNRCTACCNCAPASHIRGYTCRDYPMPNPPTETVPRNFLYLGVELETELPDANPDDGGDEALRDIAGFMHDKHGKEILMKDDGSLECGIEFVSGKYSLQAHHDLWPRLCKTILSTGLRSWKYGNTGLHVHLSRRFFTALDIGKYLVFINSKDETIRRNIRRIAGRSDNHFCKVYPKRLTDCRLSDNRYEAVNLTNDQTIEVRIFKGTLDVQHVLADIEFCHAVAYWVKEVSIQHCESWSAFWHYVTKHTKLYKHFIKFMLMPPVPTRKQTSEAPNEEIPDYCDCNREDGTV